MRLGLRAFHALPRGGILAFERVGGSLNVLLNFGILAFEQGWGILNTLVDAERACSTWMLGGHRRARKLSHRTQIITMRSNDPHNAISTNNKGGSLFKF